MQEFEGLKEKWIIGKGYMVSDPPVNIFHNDPMVTPEDGLITEVQFPIRKIT